MAKAYVKHDYAVTGRDYVETEGGGDTPAGGIDYSTEEQDTGLKWIDGKSIYQKTIDFEEQIGVSHSSWTNTTIAMSVDKILMAKGIDTGGAYQGEFLAYINGGTLNIQTPRNTDGFCRYLTIQYTKTE